VRQFHSSFEDGRQLGETQAKRKEDCFQREGEL
jgi:hypothetical protein